MIAQYFCQDLLDRDMERNIYIAIVRAPCTSYIDDV